ncbi:MAG: alpha-xylosidase [Lachnospiraceae bacterium]
MKFTEGYWDKNQRANSQHAAQAFTVEAIPNGMRVVAPTRPIKSRADAINISTITTEFKAEDTNIISVRSYHYEAYRKQEPRFALNSHPQEVSVQIDKDKAVMSFGNLSVIVNCEEFSYTFLADGNVLTSCGFRNLGYMQYDKEVSTNFPQENYLAERYEPYMMTELALAPGECVYGLGERFTAFVKNGQVVDCWNEDGGTSSQISYKNIPFYVTNKNYGILVDHSDNVSFEVASEKVEYVGFSVPGEEIRYQLIYGPSIKDVLIHYTDFTGKPALPPQWSFGLWLTTSFKPMYDEETTGAFIKGMKDRDIPLSVFHFDCFWMKELQLCDFEWDDRVFPDVKKMLDGYHAQGLKICVWINPFIAQGTPFFREGAKNGYLLQRADGRGVKQVDTWQPGMGIVDFTNPEATRWYTDKLKTLLDVGVDCFKTDFGERIPIDVTYYDGSDARAMHNYYTSLYNEAVLGLLQRERGENEAVLFARSATVGTQKFPVHWGGDCSASYPSMAESLRGGLSFAISGFSFWSHDISGFEATATPDLYKRWLQFGLLSTHSRLHGSDTYRVPWIFDEESNDVCRYFTKLKARLMPYIFHTAVISHKTGIPSMRPMVLEFEQDPAVTYLDMQYMLGESLLVAPIFNEKGRAQYYLPQGRWTNLLDGEIRQGGWHDEIYDYFHMPLFVRENTLLAVGATETTTAYDFLEQMQLQLYELQENATAECEVENQSGAVVFTASAKREGENISIQLSEVLHELTCMLYGITSYKQIEGATLVESAEGLLLRPTARTVRIAL